MLQRLFSGRLSFPAEARRHRLHLLDGARGLAAFAVLFWHYQSFYFPPGARKPVAGVWDIEPFAEPLYLLYRQGVHAVPVFWLISGFVLAFVYYGAGTSTRSFAVNRFARLYPLHLLTLLLVMVLQIAAQHRFGASLIYGNNDPYHFALQLFFASDWGFEKGFSFNAPIWSVSVEVLVYAAFWLSVRWLPRFGVALPLLATLAAYGLVDAFDAPRTSALTCAYYFFAGVTVCALARAIEPSRNALLAGGAILLAGGALGFALLPTQPPQLFLALPASVAGLMLLSVAAEPWLGARTRKICALIGDNTYGMYLWHVPIILVLFLLLGEAYDMVALASSPWFMAFYMGLVIAVARLGYVGLERPWRDRLRRLGESGEAGSEPGSKAGRDKAAPTP